MEEGLSISIGGPSSRIWHRIKGMADNKDDELPMIDLAATEGWVVDDTDEDDPVLLMPDGTAIQTWRENLSLIHI